MNRALKRFLFPDPWAGTKPPDQWEREAAWERRMGEHRAQQALRKRRVFRDFDERATVALKVVPKLPQ